MRDAVPSPCVSLCKLSLDKICQGCGRTLNEIATWSRLTDDEKRVILRQLPKPG